MTLHRLLPCLYIFSRPGALIPRSGFFCNRRSRSVSTKFASLRGRVDSCPYWCTSSWCGRCRHRWHQHARVVEAVTQQPRPSSFTAGSPAIAPHAWPAVPPARPLTLSPPPRPADTHAHTRAPPPETNKMLATGTRLQDTAVALFPVFLFFFLAFGGFIVRLPTLPGYLGSWAPPISFIRWAMEVRSVARLLACSLASLPACLLACVQSRARPCVLALLTRCVRAAFFCCPV